MKLLIKSQKENFKQPMLGFLNIYKPKGMTSHDVVSFMRKITKIKQIGHTGTLDPFAEGVLPVCIGKATRLIEFLADEKEYLATVQFGKNTDTYDLEGQVTEEFSKNVSEVDVILALKSFEGEILQMPPIYSAIKVNGKKLYDYARQGQNVEIQPRKVVIEKIELKKIDEVNQTAEILVRCSKGTYIRSIAYDLGKILGCGGHLIKLVRTQAGKFLINNSVELENCKQGIENFLINPLEMLDLQQIEISEDDILKIRNGNSIVNNLKKSNEFVILIYNNEVKAVGFLEDDKILMKKVFE